MTTIDSAAAKRFGKPITLAVLIASASFALGGCESSSNIFASSDQTNPAVANPAAQPAATQVAKVSIAKLLGPPDNVNAMFKNQLTTALESQKITVAKTPSTRSEYTLRGYVVATNEKTKTKASYVWHLTDAAGKQVHSFTGEEMLPAPQGKDPWPALTPQAVSTIVNKTSASIGGWMQSQAPAAVPVASAPPATTAQPAAKKPQIATAQPTTAPKTAAPPAQTTGSIDRNAGLNVMVASVTGAPGDGSVSLTSAMQKALTKKGVALSTKPSAQTYKVQGKVAVGQAKNGKQSVQIDWEVLDPKGKFFKRVTQKNDVPQGMLDGAWGQTADAAAAAAADTIAGLLPKQTQAQATTTTKPN